MKKRAFLLPLATALTALFSGVGSASAHVATPVSTTIGADQSKVLGSASTLPADLTIEKSNASGRKFAQHRSHSSHSSHRSHYSSRR